ncbi:MAG: tRNA pseudouridine(38-40) synthase TruA [Clostridia bacterium]|nr:tRNA pseudouridine(38-40) synthase TruA [Clostridia bacterium]
MRNILVTMMYDGSHFHGWQIQDNALTVQEVFQNALFKVIGENTDIKGCSRTDSGVHANMYCVNFHTNHTIPCKRLVAALNRYLPLSVAVTDAQEVDENFHARYNCKGKEYIYKIWNSEIRNPFLDGYALHYWYKLDVDLLNEAAKHFLGSHDFTSFCTLDNREKGDFTRTVSNISLKRDGDMVIFTIEADGFLYNMVRIIVGTLLRVAQGKIKPEQIPSIINALDRSKAGPTASPQGLYLNKVRY